MSNNKTPRITLAIPNYNGGKWLEQCLASVRAQHYPNLELIFVDGGSSDNSMRIVDKHKDLVSITISEPDEGPADAINKAIGSASGDIFHWLNSDDALEELALHRVASAFQDWPEALCIAGTVLNCDSKMNAIISTETNKGLTYKDFFRYCCGLATLDWHQPGCWWKLEAYRECGQMDKSMRAYFDRDYYLRLLRREPVIVNISHPLVRFRFHDGNISNGYPKWKAVEESHFLRRAMLADPSLAEIYRLWKRKRYWTHYLQTFANGPNGWFSACQLLLSAAEDPLVRLAPSSGTRAILSRLITSKA